jgi:hypothetical protein
VRTLNDDAGDQLTARDASGAYTMAYDAVILAGILAVGKLAAVLSPPGT